VNIEVVTADGVDVCEDVGTFETDGELAVYRPDGTLSVVYAEGYWRRVKVVVP
jgi:hypothetical protein